MGLRIITLAARTRDRAAVLADFGLVATGEEDRFFEADVSGTQIGEWTIVVINNRSAYREHVDDALLAKIAIGAELIACGIDEGSNVTFAIGLRAGHEAWSVVHDANLADRHLVVSGDVPSEMASIAARLTAAQDDDDEVDYISDVPVELVEALTGFNLLSAVDTLAVEVLVPVTGHKPRPEEANRYMEIDSRPAVHFPLACQVMATIDAMTPHGGPGFLILQGSNQDYMQTAGGDGVYLVEWREHEGGAFRHCVAGRHGAVSPGEVKISTDADNGTHVVGHRNEVLAADEVKVLARASLAGEPPPDAFAWRDISATFG